MALFDNRKSGDHALYSQVSKDTRSVLTVKPEF
jgi:hypothetical protein